MISISIILSALIIAHLDTSAIAMPRNPVNITYQIWAYPAALFENVEYAELSRDISDNVPRNIEGIFDNIDNVNLRSAYAYAYFQMNIAAEDELMIILRGKHEPIIKAAALLGYIQDISTIDKKRFTSKGPNGGEVIYKQIDVAKLRKIESTTFLTNMQDINRATNDVQLNQLYIELIGALLGSSNNRDK